MPPVGFEPTISAVERPQADKMRNLFFIQPVGKAFIRDIQCELPESFLYQEGLRLNLDQKPRLAGIQIVIRLISLGQLCLSSEMLVSITGKIYGTLDGAFVR